MSEISLTISTIWGHRHIFPPHTLKTPAVSTETGSKTFLDSPRPGQTPREQGFPFPHFIYRRSKVTGQDTTPDEATWASLVCKSENSFSGLRAVRDGL